MNVRPALRLSITLVVWLVATTASANELEAIPSQVVIDDDASVELVARGVDPDSEWLVEIGTVSAGTVKDGALHARWTLPPDAKPRRVAAALVDWRGHTARFLTVAVSRRARVRIEATPLAEVRLYLDDQMVAAGTSDARGELTLRAVVPPGNHTARVEQSTRRRAIPPRFDHLDVSDNLHVFAVPTERALVPDGAHALVIASFVYTDGAGATSSRVDVLAAKTRVTASAGAAAGVMLASVSASPREAALGPVMEVVSRARAADMTAESRVTVALAELPAAALRFATPPDPWQAATAVEVAVIATDVLGRVVGCPARLMAAPPYDDVVVEADETGKARLIVPRVLNGPLTLEAACSGVTAKASFALRAGDAAHIALSGTGEAGVEAQVSDAFGNPAPGVPPSLAATSGSIAALSERAPGAWHGQWTPRQDERREEARLVAEVGSARASRVMRHYPTTWELALGVYGGGFVGQGDFHGPGGLVTVSVSSPLLPSRLRLELSGAGWYAQRTQSIAESGRATRRAWLVPIGAGASWEMPLGIGWRLDIGATAGVLLTSTSLTAREGDTRLVGSAAGHAQGFQVSPWLRILRRTGPGHLALLAHGLVPLATIDTFSSRPVGMGLAVGYAWEP